MTISRSEILSRAEMILNSRETNSAKRLNDLEQTVQALIEFAVGQSDIVAQMKSDQIAKARQREELPMRKPRGQGC